MGGEKREPGNEARHVCSHASRDYIIALGYDNPVETDDYTIVYLLLRYGLTVCSHAINSCSLAGQTLTQEIGLLL